VQTSVLPSPSMSMLKGFHDMHPENFYLTMHYTTRKHVLQVFLTYKQTEAT